MVCKESDRTERVHISTHAHTRARARTHTHTHTHTHIWFIKGQHLNPRDDLFRVWYIPRCDLTDFNTQALRCRDSITECVFKMNAIILRILFCNLLFPVNKVPHLTFQYFYNLNFTFHIIAIKVKNTFPLLVEEVPRPVALEKGMSSKVIQHQAHMSYNYFCE